MSYSQLVQTYLGTGALAARPATPNVASGVAPLYWATDTNTLYAWDGSAWHTISGTAILLDYALASDSGTVSITQHVWSDFIANQSFTVGSGASTVEISVSGFVFYNGTAGDDFGVRLQIDSGGTPVNKMLCGARADSAGHANALQGAGVVPVTGLAAGAHTVKLQVYAPSTGVALFSNAGTQPDQYSYHIRVFERR